MPPQPSQEGVDYPVLKKAVEQNGGLFASLDLIKKTTKGNIKGYMDWLNSQDSAAMKPPPPADGQTLARTLQTLDFQNRGALFNHLETLQRFKPYPLAADSNRTLLLAPAGGTSLATPVVNPALSPQPPTTSSGGTTKVDDATDDGHLHPFYLGLSPLKVAAGGLARLPHIVFPLGRLIWQQQPSEDTRTQGPAPADPAGETNYILVVDVLTKGFPVWLIYNRTPFDRELGENVTLDPATQPPVFGPAVPNVDSVPLWPSIVTSWPSATNAVPLRELTAGFAKGGRDPVRFARISKQEVAAAIADATPDVRQGGW
ncbi:hypothetical protein QBC40DRAFT_317056 [Triangularia verruculosa]|uniref:Uncharacterized protein n=1 Tax=Triangularia verruculosa TaxID=2587418 RepID=A0AAN6XPI7_9PEZI|nr:hypothetical protein QBC40DRAFT_317056 [Triangularia verruculosa]